MIGFDIHCEPVTFDLLDDVTGEVRRGRIAPADRFGVRQFRGSLPAGQVDWRWNRDDRLAVHRRGVGRASWLIWPRRRRQPTLILELRRRVRLRKTLIDERTGWQQRSRRCSSITVCGGRRRC